MFRISRTLVACAFTPALLSTAACGGGSKSSSSHSVAAVQQSSASSSSSAPSSGSASSSGGLDTSAADIASATNGVRTPSVLGKTVWVKQLPGNESLIGASDTTFVTQTQDTEAGTESLTGYKISNGSKVWSIHDNNVPGGVKFGSTGAEFNAYWAQPNLLVSWSGQSPSDAMHVAKNIVVAEAVNIDTGKVVDQPIIKQGSPSVSGSLPTLSLSIGYGNPPQYLYGDGSTASTTFEGGAGAIINASTTVQASSSDGDYSGIELDREGQIPKKVPCPSAGRDSNDGLVLSPNGQWASTGFAALINTTTGTGRCLSSMADSSVSITNIGNDGSLFADTNSGTFFLPAGSSKPVSANAPVGPPSQIVMLDGGKTLVQGNGGVVAYQR